MKSYRVKLGGQIYDTKAKMASEAKKNVAYAYRQRRKCWDESIVSIIKKASIVK